MLIHGLDYDLEWKLQKFFCKKQHLFVNGKKSNFKFHDNRRGVTTTLVSTNIFQFFITTVNTTNRINSRHTQQIISGSNSQNWWTSPRHVLFIFQAPLTPYRYRPPFNALQHQRQQHHRPKTRNPLNLDAATVVDAVTALAGWRFASQGSRSYYPIISNFSPRPEIGRRRRWRDIRAKIRSGHQKHTQPGRIMAEAIKPICHLPPLKCILVGWSIFQGWQRRRVEGHTTKDLRGNLIFEEHDQFTSSKVRHRDGFLLAHGEVAHVLKATFFFLAKKLLRQTDATWDISWEPFWLH